MSESSRATTPPYFPLEEKVVVSRLTLTRFGVLGNNMKTWRPRGFGMKPHWCVFTQELEPVMRNILERIAIEKVYIFKLYGFAFLL